MGYRYDLHCHTAQGSACSDFDVRDMVRFYRDHGYAGFVLADHFSGNSTLPWDMPWRERVERFWEIYDTACREAERIGDIKVFFGVEFSLRRKPEDIRYCTGNDFVITNLDKQWMLEHEEAFGVDFNAGFDAIRTAGGFIIHAHPFLEASWVKSIQLLPRKVDAVEIINCGLKDKANESAKWYADRYELPYAAGSDIHHANSPMLAGVETDMPCESITQLVDAIRNRQVTLFCSPADALLIQK